MEEYFTKYKKIPENTSEIPTLMPLPFTEGGELK